MVCVVLAVEEDIFGLVLRVLPASVCLEEPPDLSQRLPDTAPWTQKPNTGMTSSQVWELTAVGGAPQGLLV